MIRKLIPFYFLLVILCIASLMSAEPREEVAGEAATRDHLKSEQRGKLSRIWQALKEKYEKGGLQQDAAAGSGLRPRIGIIVPGSGLSVGAGYGRTSLQTSASYSLRGYQDYSVQFGINPSKQSMFITSFRPWDPIKKLQSSFFLYADLHYARLAQLAFYGLGPNSLKTTHTNFELEEVSYDAVIGFRFKHRTRLDFRGGLAQINLGMGTDAEFPTTQEIFKEPSAPGLLEQPDFLHYGPSLLIDHRDSPGNPHSGGALGITLARFDDLGANNFDFNRLTVEGRYFLPLKSTSHVLAARFLTSLSDADSTSRVPFYLQETLGGANLLRGFPDYRFRDRDLILISGEYRFEAKQWLELAVFCDAGKVFSKSSQFGFQDLKKGFGAGVRFKAPAGTVFRLDGAKSDEGFMMYARFDAPF